MYKGVDKMSRYAIKVNENILYDGFTYCKKDFNIEIYLLDMDKGISEKKGFIYDVDDEDILNIGNFLKNKYDVDVEIMWNSITSEML